MIMLVNAGNHELFTETFEPMSLNAMSGLNDVRVTMQSCNAGKNDTRHNHYLTR